MQSGGFGANHATYELYINDQKYGHHFLTPDTFYDVSQGDIVKVRLLMGSDTIEYLEAREVIE